MTKPEIICLCALSKGKLFREGNLWRFDRRFFAPATVNKLIESGHAIRDGNTVRMA